MSAFTTLLEAQSRLLLPRWLRRLAETPRPDGSSPAHLEARLPTVVRALVGALRGEPVQAPQLQHFGLDARAEVFEYGVLIDLLLELAAEADVAPTPAEHRVLTRFLAVLTGDVVDAHALRRVERDRAAEAAARAQTAEAASGAPDPAPRRAKLFEMIVAGNWALDVVTQQVIADPSLLALHQLPAGAPVSLSALEAAVHPDDREELSALVAAALNPQGSGQYLMQYRVAAGPGQYRWVQTFGQTLFEHGVARQIVGTAIEITQRKEAELARDGLVKALEEQPLVQVMVLEGPEQIVTMMNAEYRKNVAGGRDLLGIPVLTAFPHLANQGFSELMKGVLASGKPFAVRDLLTPVDLGGGRLEERYFDFVVQPVRGRSGRFDTLLNLSIDVTASVEARRSLEAFVKQETERAALERQIIGVVGHDLSTPLAALKLGVRKLLEPQQALEPSAERAVHAIGGTVEEMSRLVDDLLDFSQARQGSGLSIVRAPMNLHEVVRRAVEELRPLFPQRELQLRHEGDGVGSWDAVRLSQATVNLIRNALRHSPAGTPVQVSTRALPDRVELRVSNRGAPIAPELLPRLFEPMQRGSAQAAELGRSVGLGLFIVKHIVDALGGSITVASTHEDGTTFALSFPR